MANLLTLKQDTTAQIEGRWFPWIDGVELLIAAWGNRRFNARLSELKSAPEVKGLLAAAPDSEPAQDALKRAIDKAAAECILLGWRNVENADGTPLEYTAERGEAMFNDIGWTHLREFVIGTAATARNYFVAAEAIDRGN